MALYDIPKVFYQDDIDVSIANKTEITRYKSAIFANKMNNQANCTVVVPIDDKQILTPKFKEFILIEPGDVIYQIVKLKKINDENGNLWWEIGGQPMLAPDDRVREIGNESKFIRFTYDGMQQTEVIYENGTPVAEILEADIVSSEYYEDDLGHIDELVEEAYTWGTIVRSKPKPVLALKSYQWSVTNAVPDYFTNTYGSGCWCRPSGYSGTSPNGDEYVQSYGAQLVLTQGAATGRSGYMNEIECNAEWVVNETDTYNAHVAGSFAIYDRSGDYVGSSGILGGTRSVKRLTLRTDAQMQVEMQKLLKSGSVAEVRRIVIGGHTGYTAIVKTKGQVQTRYFVDYKVGDTIRILDETLGVTYEAVVSGIQESIGQGGYDLDITLGTVGSTIQQQIRKTG